jgi:predicted DCC family thiol-disulfide oxidoreductase YuxK
VDIKNQKIILFDGFCNLCNSSVQFIIKRDRKSLFKFASLQSDVSKEITVHLDTLPDSIVFYDEGDILVKSDAALKIASYL